MSAARTLIRLVNGFGFYPTSPFQFPHHPLTKLSEVTRSRFGVYSAVPFRHLIQSDIDSYVTHELAALQILYFNGPGPTRILSSVDLITALDLLPWTESHLAVLPKGQSLQLASNPLPIINPLLLNIAAAPRG